MYIPRLMTYKQAMKYLNIKSYNTLYVYINNGLPVTHLGNTKRIDKNELDKFIASRTKKEVI
ncbi:helix-turn-helix domain-containing protein [Nicoliella lavandulae]|uniref:Helix-turn-helix domain-containing protein n=1 Tax=Nicoliella lavandulae TaxID=3082954 RepID=A0ABU8SJ64_9LACO